MLKKAVAKGRIVDAVQRLDEIEGALRALQTMQPSLLSAATRRCMGDMRDNLDHLRRLMVIEAGLRRVPRPKC